MKKQVLLSALLAALILTGCGSEEPASQQQSAAETTAQTEVQVTTEAQEAADTTAAQEETVTSAGRIDLTGMSSTMVMAQISTMQYEPDSFLGKTIKMQGTFLVGYGDTRNYYYCLVSDATACCQQGFEFLWDGHVFPDDYPEPGTEIIVEGIFDTYWEDGYQYMQLINATLEPV